MKRKLKFSDYRMFAEAWLFLAIARLMLIFRPFRKIVPLLQKKSNKAQADPSLLPGIQLAIARACVRSPWRTKCFEQALAAKMMLNRRGLASITYFGVLKNQDQKKMHAHAWLKCGDFVVTGWSKVDEYTVLASF